MTSARELRVLKWVGAAAQMAGVVGMASRLVDPALAYGLMLTGTVGWTGVGLLTRDRPLALMNGTFALANAVGLLRWSHL